MNSESSEEPEKKGFCSLEELREDLRFQLDTPDEIDWDYFLEIAKRAQSAANREGKNMKENAESSHRLAEPPNTVDR